MKLKAGFILLGLGLLSSCATLSGSQNNALADQSDQKALSIAFNTAKDGTEKAWTSSDGTQYALTTAGTHVNYQGVPCRNFSLNMVKSFYNSNTLTGTACRYDNKWTDIQKTDV